MSGRYLARFPLVKSPTYNGVIVRASHFPWEDVSKPSYESGLVSGIKKQVQSGDSVVIVGGGQGVTAVKAARQVGRRGQVIVFEGSKQQVQNTKKTSDINNVSDIVCVHNCIVGPAKAVYGKEDKINIKRVSPEDLPRCDVLELDCEGAEIEILRNLSQKPRVILVETHGLHDASSNQIRTILEDMSYNVVSKVVADESKEQFCRENDIFALTAIIE